MDRRLVDHLVNSSLVSRAAMQRMILRASKDKTSLVDQLLSDDKIDEQSVARELAAYYGLGVVTPARFSVNQTALKFISKSMAHKHGVLPFAVSDAADHVTVAVYNPESAQSVVESLKTATGREPTVQVAPRAWLNKAIRYFYFGDAWAEAPEHKATTREIEDLSDAFDAARGLSSDDSSEIVLDEVVVPPAPRARQRRSQSVVGGDATPTPHANEPRRRSQSGFPPDQTQQDEVDGHVDAALNEFDAFLDHAVGWGNRSGSSGVPGWDEDEESVQPASWDEGEAVHRQSGNGFSLFDEKSEPIGSLDVVVAEQAQQLAKLQRELQQQRDIITALVDALAESGVVSKREIKHRVKRK